MTNPEAPACLPTTSKNHFQQVTANRPNSYDDEFLSPSESIINCSSVPDFYG